jgi:hypothetical protein
MTSTNIVWIQSDEITFNIITFFILKLVLSLFIEKGWATLVRFQAEAYFSLPHLSQMVSRGTDFVSKEYAMWNWPLVSIPAPGLNCEDLFLSCPIHLQGMVLNGAYAHLVSSIPLKMSPVAFVWTEASTVRVCLLRHSSRGQQDASRPVRALAAGVSAIPKPILVLYIYIHIKTRLWLKKNNISGQKSQIGLDTKTNWLTDRQLQSNSDSDSDKQ